MLKNSALLRIFIIFITVFLFFGCNIKSLYNQLDWIIPWFVNSFLPLNNQQNAILDDRLDVILEWHRNTQLPVYVDTLRTIIDDVKSGLSNDNLDYVMNLFRKFQEDFTDYIKPEMADFMKTLTDQQVDILLRNFEKNNEEYKSKNIDLPEIKIRNNFAEDMKKNLERILGKLSEKQKEIIENWSLQQELTGEEELEERLRWQAVLKNTLLLRNFDSVYEYYFKSLFDYSESVRPASYQAKLDYNKQLMQSTLLLIDYSITDTQRGFLVNRMTDIADQLEEIIKE